MQDENITEQQSLAIIESMINKAKNQFSENGFSYLLWGWVIFFCSVSQFVLRYVLQYPRHYLVWMLTWVAAIVQIIYHARRAKKKTVQTYTGEIMRYVWIAFVTMLLLSGVLFSRDLQPQQHYVANIMILILYGMPTFLSGIILQFRPLIAGGITCWALSLIAGFIPHEFVVLLLSVAVIAAWILPGYLLSKKYKKENQL